MRKIQVGDKVYFGVPEGREHKVSPVEGTVYKMNYSEIFKAYSIFIKPYNSFNLSVITTAKIEYDGQFVYKGKVTPKELEVIQSEMRGFAGPPKTAKKSVKRGKMKVNENAVLTPNTGYAYNQIEGYIRTKKVWRQITHTTAKMAFFEGGRCSINNVEKVRQIK